MKNALIVVLFLMSCLFPNPVFAEDAEQREEVQIDVVEPIAPIKEVEELKDSIQVDDSAQEEITVEEVEVTEIEDSGKFDDIFESDDVFADVESEEDGVDIILLMDSSGSMLRTDPDRLRDQGAKLLLRFLGNNDQISIIQFDKETKTIHELRPIDSEKLLELDKAIESVSVKGGFTNISEAIAKAIDILDIFARKNSKKCVVLLSDGKMDPHPDHGSASELTEKALNTDIPRYISSDVKLYTVALSESADRDLLSELAKKTNGLHWYAPDVDTIHKKFSDLFMSLKQPQVVAMENGGFEIDGSVQEATFYINRNDQYAEVHIVDPLGTELSYGNTPDGYKWYHGKFFDVVTIKNPIPGSWVVTEANASSGFATLITDVELKVSWPITNAVLGDRVKVQARLLQEGSVLENEDLAKLLFYTYKIINVETGQVIAKGKLNDQAVNGDDTASDSTYSTVLSLDHTGDFKAFIGVTSPTFSRQRQIPFSVFDGLITLELKEEHGAKWFEARLTKNAAEIEKPQVAIMAKKEHGMILKFPLQAFGEDNDQFRLDAGALPPGSYELYAQVKGKKGEEEHEGTSKIIKFEVAGEKTQEHHEVEVVEVGAEEEVEEEHAETSMVLGAGLTAGSLVWAVLLGFLAIRKIDSSDTQVEIREPYVVGDDLLNKLKAIGQKAMHSQRDASDSDRAIFPTLAALFDNKEHIEHAYKRGLKRTGLIESNSSENEAVSEDGEQDEEGSAAAEAEENPAEETEKKDEGGEE